MNIEAGSTALYNGESAIVMEVKRGWYTILVDDETKKVRASALSSTEPEERDMKSQMAQARKKYTATKTYAGERSMDNGDKLAQLMRGLEPLEVCSLADSLYKEAEGHHSGRYGHLNAGQIRMNSGNRIRGGVKRSLFSLGEVETAFAGLHLTARGQE